MLAAFQVPREALAVHPGERHRRQEGEAAADRRCRIVVVAAVAAVVAAAAVAFAAAVADVAVLARLVAPEFVPSAF